MRSAPQEASYIDDQTYAACFREGCHFVASAWKWFPALGNTGIIAEAEAYKVQEVKWWCISGITTHFGLENTAIRRSSLPLL
jgi:hypothetical protein